jgi:hypothetical protein
MISDAPQLIAQAEPSTLDQNLLQQQINQAQQNLNNSPQSAQNLTAKPVLKLINFLKTKFFGKTLPLSDKNHKLTGIGIVIGVFKQGDEFFCIMSDTEKPSTFNVKVVFEKELFGSTFTDVAKKDSAVTQQHLDIENGLSKDIGPLLGYATGDTPASAAPAQQQETLSTMQSEAITYFDKKTQTTQKGNLVFIKGRPFFQDDGLPLFIRMEKP